MSKFSDKLRTFMYGRNGADTLYWFFMGVSLFFFLAYSILTNIFKNIPACIYIGYVSFALFVIFFILCMTRFYSRNVSQRSRENDRFKDFFRNISKFFRIRRRAFKERKQFVYKKCPHCKNYLRLKRIKGEHTVKCPKCSDSFKVKVH